MPPAASPPGSRVLPGRPVPARAARVRRPALTRLALVAGLALAVASAASLPFLLSSTPPVSAAPEPVVLPPTAGDSGIAASAATGPGTPHGDMRRIALDVDGMARSYVLVPALGLEPGQRSGLLVVLHQDVSSGQEISVDLGLDALRRHGVTLAYPDGHGGSWNSGACCGAAMRDGVDDVAFVNRVLDDVGRHVPVDPGRRALLGYSGGGMLAYRVLCAEHPPLVAAVEVNGSLEVPCAQDIDLPELLSVHGADDGSIGLRRSGYVNHLKMAPRSVRATLDTVTRRAGCGLRVSTRTNGVDVWSWDACRGGGSVEAQIVPDAGHGWADVGGAPRALAWLLPRLSVRS